MRKISCSDHQQHYTLKMPCRKRFSTVSVYNLFKIRRQTRECFSIFSVEKTKKAKIHIERWVVFWSVTFAKLITVFTESISISAASEIQYKNIYPSSWNVAWIAASSIRLQEVHLREQIPYAIMALCVVQTSSRPSSENGGSIPFEYNQKKWIHCQPEKYAKFKSKQGKRKGKRSTDSAFWHSCFLSHK